MTTFDATVSILEQLSEEKLKVINSMALRLLNHETDNPYRPLTEEEWLAKLDAACEQAENGRVQDAAAISADLRERIHGLCQLG